MKTYEELVKDTTKEDQYIAVNGIKKGFENLNKLNSGIKFKLYTTNEGLMEYGIQKIDKFSKTKDIPLYIYDGNIKGVRTTLAATEWNYNSFSYELEKESLTYKKEALFTVWNNFKTNPMENEFDYLNCLSYRITIHEAGHLEGLAHVDTDESIMNPYMSILSGVRDFSWIDEKIIDKLNVDFYGTTPRFADYSDALEAIKPKAKTEEQSSSKQNTTSTKASTKSADTKEVIVLPKLMHYEDEDMSF